MSCTAITSGVSRDCLNAAGGLSDKIYVTDFDNLTQSLITEASGSLTNTTSFLSTGKKFWTIELITDRANETETAPENTNGNLSYDQVLNAFIPKKQATLNNYLHTLAQRRLAVIAPDNLGQWRILGLRRGMLLKWNSASGTLLNDDNGYNLTFKGSETSPAPFISSSLLSALLSYP